MPHRGGQEEGGGNFKGTLHRDPRKLGRPGRRPERQQDQKAFYRTMKVGGSKGMKQKSRRGGALRNRPCPRIASVAQGQGISESLFRRGEDEVG